MTNNRDGYRILGARCRARVLRAGLVAGAVPLAAAGVIGLAAPAWAAGPSVPPGYTISTVTTGGKLTKIDDIVALGGRLYVGYQNGVGSKGEPAKSGATMSTIVAYTRTGTKIAQWQVTGKVDGIGADPANNRVIATVNEDGNSSLYAIDPAAASAQHYTYSPPLTHGGGTDSIVAANGKLLISASAPGSSADVPAVYAVSLSGTTATDTAVFKDNSSAASANNGANSGKSEILALTDPDSSEAVPGVSPRFAGDFALDSQADKELIFASGVNTPSQALHVLHLSAEINDTAWATSTRGTLYVTDSGTNSLVGITGTFPLGRAYSAVTGTTPGTVDTLDLSSGALTPFATGLSSPSGLLFVPAAAGGQVSAVPQGAPATGGGSTSRSPIGLLLAGLSLLAASAGMLVVRVRLRRQ